MKAVIVTATYEVPLQNQPEFLRIVGAKRKYFVEKGFATDRTPVLMHSHSRPEILIEVFEWTSEQAIQRAHEDPGVLEFWGQMEKQWTRGGFPLSELPESSQQFPNFAPVDGVYGAGT